MRQTRFRWKCLLGTRLDCRLQKQRRGEDGQDPDHEVADGWDVEHVDQLEAAPQKQQNACDERGEVLPARSTDEHRGRNQVGKTEHEKHGHTYPEEIPKEDVREREPLDDGQEHTHLHETSVRTYDEQQSTDQSGQAVQEADDDQEDPTHSQHVIILASMCLTLYIEPIQLFSPGSVSIHFMEAGANVNLYRKGERFLTVFDSQPP